MPNKLSSHAGTGKTQYPVEKKKTKQKTTAFLKIMKLLLRH